MERCSTDRKSIVVSGYYGYRNMGDDAILEMICRDYAADYDLTVLTLRPKETEESYHVKTVHRFHMRKVLRTIKDADLLLSGGGSLLQDKTSTRSLLYYLTIIKAAQHYGVPSMLYASGIGPIRSAANRKRVARVLRNLDLISLREKESAAFARELCPGKQAILTADPVFHMQASPDSAAEEILARNGLDSASMFAVSLRSTKQADSVRIAELLDRLAALSGCMPIFICMQDPADYEYAGLVQSLMKERSHILTGCRYGPDMIAVLRRMRGVVSMRLHALIFGALASVPLIGFGVDPKIGALLHTLHAPEPTDLRSFDPAEAAARFAQIMREDRAPDIEEQVALSKSMPAIVRGMLEPEDRRFALHIISGGDSGGAKMHVLSLLEGLAEKGCRVLLVCFMEGNFAIEANEAGIPVMILPRDRILGNTLWLKRYIERNGVDIVHCHGSRANMYGALLRSRIDAPVLTTIHSDPDLDYMGRPVADRIFGRINRQSLRKIDWQVCVSDELQRKMEEKGIPADHLFQICNGIDCENFSPAVTREQWYRERGLQIPADAVVFGTAARLSPVKDITTLISAFSRVVKRCPNARLLIAGEGSEAARLRNKAERLCPKDSVVFTGWLEDMPSFYQAIDVNVLSSLSEGFPYAIPEGSLMRCATIATRVGSIPNVISDGETGFLIEPGDVSTLAERMGRLIEQPELRQRLGEALFRRIERDYSLETMVRTQLAIYDRVCGKEFACAVEND